MSGDLDTSVSPVTQYFLTLLVSNILSKVTSNMLRNDLRRVFPIASTGSSVGSFLKAPVGSSVGSLLIVSIGWVRNFTTASVGWVGNFTTAPQLLEPQQLFQQLSQQLPEQLLEPQQLFQQLFQQLPKQLLELQQLSQQLHIAFWWRPQQP